MTAHGKLNRQSVPAPDAERAGAEVVQPRGATEEQLARIWAHVLGRDDVGVEDNFFAVGGHSALADQVVARVRASFSIELSPAAVFDAPTISQLGRAVDLAVAEQRSLSGPSLVPVGRDRELPLSLAQERMWLFDQLVPDSPLYNVPGAFRLSGRLDGPALERAVNEIVARHEALRTRFPPEHGKPRQVIEPPAPLPFPLTDLGDVHADERETRMLAICADEALRPFDLAQGPLVRVRLLRLGELDHVLVLNLHQIVSDGRSQDVLISELLTLYGAFSRGDPSPLAPLNVQYSDYAVWQRGHVESGALADGLGWWHDQLADAPQKLDLPTDHPRPRTPTYRGAHHAFMIRPQLTERLREVARAQGVTLSMVLLTGFEAVLARYTAAEEFLIGTPMAGRNRLDLERIVGPFVNTVVVRANMRGDPTIAALLARTRATLLDAFAHADVPFEQVVQKVSSQRDPSRAPLFQVMFLVQEDPTPSRLPGLDLKEVRFDRGTSEYDISLGVAERGDRMECVLEYNCELLEPSTLARLAGHLLSVFEGMAADPGSRLSQLELLIDTEIAQLAAWNATATDVNCDRGMHELFEAQAARRPESVAIRFNDETISYAELEGRANRLANQLLAFGLGPDRFVGICLDRTPSMLVAMLGTLKAGAAFVGLDPRLPTAQLAFRVKDLDVRVVVTEHGFVSALPDVPRLLLLDSEHALAACESKPAIQIPGVSLAYAIYTSGSTGTPKAVGIQHRGAVSFLAWARSFFPDEDFQGALATTSALFDCILIEIFAPLSAGGTVVLASDILELAVIPARNRVTLVSTVPSAMATLVELKALPDSVRTANLSGDVALAGLIDKLATHTRIERVLNHYGLSEATTYSTGGEVWTRDGAVRRFEGRPSIGSPIDNTQVHVLDRDLNRLPIGPRANYVWVGWVCLAATSAVPV